MSNGYPPIQHPMYPFQNDGMAVPSSPGCYQPAPPPPYSNSNYWHQPPPGPGAHHQPFENGQPYGNPWPQPLPLPPPLDAFQYQSCSTPSLSSGSAQPARDPGSKRLDNKIIAIPATAKKLGSPFLRAYAPALQACGISRDAFLGFVDGLNRIAVASPPLQVLGLAGNIAGLVPLATAQLVGGIVNAAATIGTIAVSKAGTAVYLRDANRDVFGPRGLTVEIAKLEAVAQAAGIPILDHSGSLVKASPLLSALDDDAELQSLGVQQRRLRALEPWIAPLELLELPRVQVPDGALSKLSAKASERQRQAEEKKLMESRQKAHGGFVKDSREARRDYDEKMFRLDKEADKIRHKERKHPERMERELKKLEVEREKALNKYKAQVDKAERGRLKGGEEKAMSEILWLLIREVSNAGAYAGVSAASTPQARMPAPDPARTR